MVIAEVLNEIKDLEKRRRELISKTRDGIYILPDLKEEEKPDALEDQVTEIMKITEQIAAWRVRLVQTNISTSINVENRVITLMAAIKEIEAYRFYETQLTEIANHMDNKNVRYFNPGSGYMSQGEPITLVPNFTTTSKALRQKARDYHAQARNIEQALVKANWQTEVA